MADALDVWEGGDSPDGGQSVEWGISATTRRVVEQLQADGYREGLDVGVDEVAQAAFNAGFREGVRSGYERGWQVGAARARLLMGGDSKEEEEAARDSLRSALTLHSACYARAGAASRATGRQEEEGAEGTPSPLAPLGAGTVESLHGELGQLQLRLAFSGDRRPKLHADDCAKHVPGTG